jgi:hypothetical protein
MCARRSALQGPREAFGVAAVLPKPSKRRILPFPNRKVGKIESFAARPAAVAVLGIRFNLKR